MKKQYALYTAKFKGFFLQGLNPAQLSITVSLGFCLGLFPVIGLTSVLCFAFALGFKLNIVIMQVANWLLAPLQFLLIIPFYQFGAWLLGSNQNNNNLDKLNHLFDGNFLNNFLGVLNLQLIAILGWAVFSIPFTLLAYWVTLKISKQKAAKATL